MIVKIKKLNVTSCDRNLAWTACCTCVRVLREFYVFQSFSSKFVLVEVRCKNGVGVQQQKQKTTCVHLYIRFLGSCVFSHKFCILQTNVVF